MRGSPIKCIAGGGGGRTCEIVREDPALKTDIGDVVRTGKWFGVRPDSAAVSASEPRAAAEVGCRPRGEAKGPVPRGESSCGRRASGGETGQRLRDGRPPRARECKVRRGGRWRTRSRMDARSVPARDAAHNGTGAGRGEGDATLSDSEDERCACPGRGEAKLSIGKTRQRRWDLVVWGRPDGRLEQPRCVRVSSPRADGGRAWGELGRRRCLRWRASAAGAPDAGGHGSVWCTREEM